MRGDASNNKRKRELDDVPSMTPEPDTDATADDAVVAETAATAGDNDSSSASSHRDHDGHTHPEPEKNDDVRASSPDRIIKAPRRTPNLIESSSRRSPLDAVATTTSQPGSVQ